MMRMSRSLDGICASQTCARRLLLWSVSSGLLGQSVSDFMAPREPSRRDCPGKYFEPRGRRGPFDHLADHFRLLAVATARRFKPTAQAVIVKPVFRAAC